MKPSLPIRWEKPQKDENLRANCEDGVLAYSGVGACVDSWVGSYEGWLLFEWGGCDEGVNFCLLLTGHVEMKLWPDFCCEMNE